MKGKLIFKDGTEFEGESFGYEKSTAGEVVFTTGMVGYPESLTDPSYLGQILIMTYPLVGNYGVPDKEHWESDSLKISGLIVSNYIDSPSHFQSASTISEWLKNGKVPALQIKDTRQLAIKIRKGGAMLGKIVFENDRGEIPFYDPNDDNLVSKVSVKQVVHEGKGKKTVVMIDGGEKRNIKRNFLKRGVRVITVPWNYDPFDPSTGGLKFDGLVISNGPGDPKKADKTIETVQKALKQKIPIFGICLGHQILALASGGDTYKLKYGHRGQNQPCILVGTKKCFLTTQNHGFAVGKMPKGFKPWFINANDGTNEGIIHEKLPIMSVQFHPEVTPGPRDTEWIFDHFISLI
ncbi:MAG TPA: glutamine-hydrolyzing carbamoyl-phosphate synthase small subunit [Candidatus Nitrosocosmicus sp.]|nr:glutamine-hydrolyzing carbamoyl-phosphate synthase small subunit [Candidatus Nitrosocosmicus sp.]